MILTCVLVKESNRSFGGFTTGEYDVRMSGSRIVRLQQGWHSSGRQLICMSAEGNRLIASRVAQRLSSDRAAACEP